MIARGLSVVAALACGALAQEARFTFDDARSLGALLPAPDHVVVAHESGSLKVAFTGETTSIPLVRVPMRDVEGPYVYKARVKSLGAAGPAYLEMWSEFEDASYFSRALNQSLTGTTEWRECTTPFLLKPSDPRPQSVTLGIRMEGPGTVWVDDMRLEPGNDSLARMVSSSAVSNGWIRFWSWAGALLGVIGGTWGSLAGYFAPRGKGRGALIVTGYGIMALCVVSLIYGLWALTAQPFMEAYPALLLGGLGVVIFPPLIGVTKRQYRQAELRRMQAMDVA